MKGDEQTTRETCRVRFNDSMPKNIWLLVVVMNFQEHRRFKIPR